jgi:hypothetical protein
MLPDAPFAFLVLLALFPGWIFVRLAETKSERPDRSPLAELLELGAVGFSTIAAAAIIVAALPITGHFSWLFNVEVWAHIRNQYLGDHLGAALASIAVTMILSCALAIALFVAIYRQRPGGSVNAGGTVWVRTFGAAPAGMHSWVGIHFRDGSLIEGMFLSCTAGVGDGPRDISLMRPIRRTAANGEANDLSLDRVVIPDTEITAVTVKHVPTLKVAEKGPRHRLLHLRLPHRRKILASGHRV